MNAEWTETGSDFSELVGPGADEAATELRGVVEMLLNRLAGRYRLIRDNREDLTQEVLAICVQQAYKIQSGAAKPLLNRDAWLCRVTHNAVLGLGRKTSRRRDEHGWPEGFEPPTPVTLAAEERLTVRRALATLDNQCRQLLVLRDVLEESRQEIAANLDISSNALGVRLHRCRKKLLELYQGLGKGLGKPS